MSGNRSGGGPPFDPNGGRAAKTDRRGRARLKLRPRHQGKLVAAARPRGCPTARASVRVLPRHRR